MSEGRRFPRIPARTTILLESLGSDGVEELARTRTVGRGGCGLLSPEPLVIGSALRILISVHHEVVRARGRVVYCHPAETGYEVGVEFLDISPEDEVTLTHLDPDTQLDSDI